MDSKEIRKILSFETKGQMEAFSGSLAEAYADSPSLAQLVEIRKLHNVLDGFLRDRRVVDATVNLVEKYGRNTMVGETRIEIKETGTKYDFTVCDDPVWTALKEQEDAVAERRRQREAYLKILTRKKEEIVEETGEVASIFPPARTSTTSFAVTFKK